MYQRTNKNFINTRIKSWKYNSVFIGTFSVKLCAIHFYFTENHQEKHRFSQRRYNP